MKSTDDEIIEAIKVLRSTGNVPIDVRRVPDGTVPGPGEAIVVTTPKENPTDARTFLVSTRHASPGYKPV